MAEDISDLKARLVAGFQRGGRRRRFDPQAKQELVEACLQPNVSVSGMALEHGLNANLLRRWISDHVRARSGGAGTQVREAASPAFVPMVQLGGAPTVVPGSGQRPVRLEAARTSPCLPSPSRLVAELFNGVMLKLELDHFVAALQHRDGIEGITAFLEKRQARYR